MKYFLSKIRPVILLLFLIVLISYLLSQLTFEGREDLRVYFLDVGQGDAIFIDAPNGEQILVDAGRGDKVLNKLNDVMKFYDKKIDTLVLSHADLDHIGGFFDVLDIYDVEKILRSSVPIESKYENEILEIAKNQGVEIEQLSVGNSIIIDQEKGIYMDVLWPKYNDELVDGENNRDFDRNENSLILRLVFGESEIILTGDASVYSESKLIESYGDGLQSDVLKVGHHGSKTSTSKEFLKFVNPEFAVISYGENSYGHPDKGVVENLLEEGIEVVETKKSGTIIFEISDMDIKILNSESGVWESIKKFLSF